MKRRLPDAANDALMSDLIADAGRMICAYTMRDAVPGVLETAQLEIALILYNRMGMEGEATHDEGSIRRSAESLPEYIRRQLNPYRRAKAVGTCD